MSEPAKPSFPSGFWFVSALLLLGIWQVFSQFGEMHRPLADYHRLSGKLCRATLARTHGKGAYWYVQFILTGAEQPFGFRNEGQAMLSQLTPLLNGPELTVYYDAPGLFNEVNFNVAQLEAPGQILYSLDSTHNKAGGSFAWLLLLLAVALPLTVKFYLDHRATRRDDL